MKSLRLIVPLAVFLAIAIFLWVGLYRDPREVPSPLINKPAPAFVLPRLHEPTQSFSPETMRGKVWLLNVWASWCVACREEHAFLNDLSKQGVPLVGLNYKDQRENALKWLERFNNPYTLSVSDSDGHVGIDYGVYGAPETFVIDKQGVIRYKQIGAVTPEVWRDKIEPLMRKLQS
jgi:cytochrome c biogenesis protein CcmG/thiol:disulfide interchange protein DsbE